MVQIGKFRLTQQNYSYTLSEVKEAKETGNEYTELVGYYPSLTSALNKLIELETFEKASYKSYISTKKFVDELFDIAGGLGLKNQVVKVEKDEKDED
jgi:hypothetical protein